MCSACPKDGSSSEEVNVEEDPTEDASDTESAAASAAASAVSWTCPFSKSSSLDFFFAVSVFFWSSLAKATLSCFFFSSSASW